MSNERTQAKPLGMAGGPGAMRKGPGGFGGGPAHMGAPVEKPKDFKGTFKRLVKYLKPHRLSLVVIFVFAIASTIFTIAAPKITGQAMNKLKDAFVARMVLNQVSKAQAKAREDIAAMVERFKQAQASEGQAGQNQAATLKAIQEFMALPLLDSVEDNAKKAEICTTVMDMARKMPQGVAGEAGGGPIKMTKEQIDDAIRAVRDTGGKIDYKAIGGILLLLLCMYVVSAGFTFLTQWIMSSVAQKTVYDLRMEVNDKLGRLPLKYFDSRTHGEVLSRVTNDIDTISNTLQQSITQVISSIVQIIGFVIMMLTISPILTLIVIATLPLYFTVTVVVAKKSQKYFAAQQKEIGALSGHVEEMFSGHAIVKAFGREKQSVDTFNSINERLNQAGWKAQFVSGIMFPLMNFVSNLGYVIISVVGGLWMTKNRLALGDITAFIQYSRSFTHPIVLTSNIANILQSTIACAERVFEVLDEKEEEPDSPGAKALENPQGEVSLKNVSFRYKEDIPLIDGLDLEVRKGHTIAIVGPTGAGKTTLVNLLMRFYEVNGGSVNVDGVNIRDIPRNDLRSMFGMVLQDTWLFNGTIRENIAYGKPGAMEEEVVRAAKAAHADHFIRTLPEGYNTVLNEEASNISQGQKQLITIARAVLADPAILILDEATSSVDTRTEFLIQKAMADLMEGRTSFVIAHRLSTIRDAELILVMNHGSIIEQGTHRELLAKGGFYAELYNAQFVGPAVEEAAS